MRYGSLPNPMKKSPLVVSVLLATSLLIVVVRSNVGSPGAEEGGEISKEEGSEQEVGRQAERAGVKQEHRQGVEAAGERSQVLSEDLVEELALEAEAVLPLPDGRSLPLLVSRRERDAKGVVTLVEGTVSHPAPGRFLFRRQPEGALPGPMVGFVFYPSLEYGFRVETVGGQSRLVQRSVHDIACVEFGAPAEGVQEEIPADHPTGIPIPGYQNGVIPLQSLPGAAGVIYLDFDGEEGPHSGWGDFDAVSHGSNNTQIFDVWRRVAEDFAAFNLNVTTDLQVYLDAAETSRQRCIVTPTTDAAPGAGGVAYLNSFNWAGDTPCWAFYGSGKASAEVISHEIGHTMSLSHDGRTTPSEGYYGGHGSGDTGWAPIMGVGYYRNLTQWSKGEYLNANQTQDDLDRIINNNNTVAYRADDHAATHLTATPLGFDTGGQADDEGNIETDGDVDAFVFTTTTGGVLNVSIDPVSLGPNVDLLVELYDDGDVLLESSNPLDALDATLSSSIGAGTFTIRVTNTGKGDPLATGYTGYATLGEYTITGTIPGAVLPDQFDIAENSVTNDVVGTVVPRNAHGANPLTFAITSGNSAGAFKIGVSDGEIAVDDGSVLDVEALSAGWHDPAVFELEVVITDTVSPGLNETIRVLITVLDVNEAPTIAGTSMTILEHTRVGRELHTLVASDPDRLDAISYAITAGDPAGRFEIDNAGVLKIAADLAYATQSSYNLTVTATDSGALFDTATVTVNLIDTVEGYVPGSVVHAFYRGIGGNNISDLTGDPDFPSCPDDISERDEIHADADGGNYGRVVRSYLIPPISGNYTFWIAGDDGCELLLSTDEDPGNAGTIAAFSGYTGYQVWTKYSGQESVSIPLVGGQAYYLEARQKEGGGGDHLSVAWEVRDGSNAVVVPREPISGLYFAPHAFNYCPRLADAAVTIRDNVYAGALLHGFVATDLNPGDSHSFAITAGDPGGKFGIDPVSGDLTLNDATGLASSYNLTVTATDDGSPVLAGSGNLAVTVVPAGTIDAAEPLLEIWDGLSGTSLSTLTGSSLFPDRPERLGELTDLDSGQDWGNDYGARVRAYLTPVTSGAYTFYIASDDQGSLLLSSDDDPANAAEIASVSGWTGYREWDKYPLEQTSAVINLTAGVSYFIEARVKEGGGGDHVAVAWTGPGIATITVIDASLIEPFDSNVAPDLSPLNPVADLGAGVTAGTLVTTFSAVDSPFETLTYSILAGDVDGVFAVDPQSGEVTVSDPAMLKVGPYQLTVGVQDSGHGGNFPLRDTTTTLTVHIDDTDRDDLPDSWEIAQFGVLAHGGGDDTDLDSYNNRSEFVFGTLANDLASMPVGPKANGVGAPGAYRFELVVRNDLSPGAYLLHVSSDLENWTPLGPGDYSVVGTTPVDTNHDLLTLEVVQGGDECFLKAGVE